MTRRKRNVVIGTVVVLLLGELTFRAWVGRVACVTIANQSGETIEDLRLEYGNRVARVARIEAGSQANVYLSGRGEHPLKVSYRLKGSALPGFDVAAFDPSVLHGDGARLVLTIRLDEWERHREPETSAFARLADRAQTWIAESFVSP